MGQRIMTPRQQSYSWVRHWVLCLISGDDDDATDAISLAICFFRISEGEYETK